VFQSLRSVGFSAKSNQKGPIALGLVT